MQGNRRIHLILTKSPVCTPQGWNARTSRSLGCSWRVGSTVNPLKWSFDKMIHRPSESSKSTKMMHHFTEQWLYFVEFWYLARRRREILTFWCFCKRFPLIKCQKVMKKLISRVNFLPAGLRSVEFCLAEVENSTRTGRKVNTGVNIKWSVVYTVIARSVL